MIMWQQKWYESLVMKEQGPCRDEKFIKWNYYSNKTEKEVEEASESQSKMNKKRTVDNPLIDVFYFGFELRLCWLCCAVILVKLCLKGLKVVGFYCKFSKFKP